MTHGRAGGQFIRYAIVGLTANLLLYLGYLGLTAVGTGHKIAMTLLYATGVLLTFIVNRSWSFSHRGMIHAAFTRYLIAYALGYLLNLSLLWLAVDLLHLPHRGVQAAAIVVVALSLFVLHRYWVFALPPLKGAA